MTPQSFSLEELPKVTQVDGKNLNTGGSSGAAKTTMLRTLDYGLGVNDVAATVLQSRLTKEPLWVEIDGDWDGFPCTVHRSKGSLRVTGTDPKSGEAFSVSGSSELGEEKIDAILGLPRELFKKITHKEQGEGGFFLKMKPKEMYEFMLLAMRMGEWIKKMDKAEADASLVRPLIPKVEAEVEVARREWGEAVKNFERVGLEQEPEQPDVSGKPELETLAISLRYEIAEIDKKRPMVMSILDKKKPAKPELPGDTAYMGELRTAVSNFEAEIAKVDGEKQEKVNRFRAQISTLNTQAVAKKRRQYDLEKQCADFRGEKASLTELVLQRASVESEMAAHADKKCPTCSQHWEGAGLSPHAKMLKVKLDSIAKAEARLPELDAQHAAAAEELEALVVDVPKLEARVTQATAILNKLTDEDQAAEMKCQLAILRSKLQEEQGKLTEQARDVMAAYDAEMKVYLSKRKDVEDDIVARRKEHQDHLDRTEAKIRELDGKWSVYEHLVQRHRDAMQAAEKNVDSWSQKLQVAEKKCAETKAELALYEDARRAIKAYTMTKFEGALEQIGRLATETVNRIPNMATAVISFEPFKEVNGKIKDEIVALVGMDGEESVPLKSLSGGERNGADNAIDLAVIDLIEQVSGIGSNYYIMDEPLDGQDSVCKVEFMEMLKSSTTNKRLLLVTHDPIAKELAEHTITVEREGTTSRIL